MEPVAAEETRLSLHLAKVQAPQQGLAGLGGPVERHHRIDPVADPRRVARMRSRQGKRRLQRGGLRRGRRLRWRRRRWFRCGRGEGARRGRSRWARGRGASRRDRGRFSPLAGAFRRGGGVGPARRQRHHNCQANGHNHAPGCVVPGEHTGHFRPLSPAAGTPHTRGSESRSGRSCRLTTGGRMFTKAGWPDGNRATPSLGRLHQTDAAGRLRRQRWGFSGVGAENVGDSLRSAVLR